MEIKKNLELVDVKKNESHTTAELMFFDDESQKVYVVKFSRQKWNKTTQQFEDDEEKAKKTDEHLMKEFGVDFNDLTKAIGQKHDVYVYAERENPFCSLWESTNLEKVNEEFFKKYRGGVDTKIESIEDTGERIRLIFTVDGNKYGSSNGSGGFKLRYGEWIDQANKFIPNALMEKKAFNNFNEIFGIPFDKKDDLIGKTINIFPMKAGKNYYIEFEYNQSDADLPF